MIAGEATVELKVGAGQTYTTIQAAVDAVPPTLDQPYVINIAPGVYTELVTIKGKTTTPTNNLTLLGNPSNPPIIDAEDKRDNALALDNQSNVVIDGFWLRGAVKYGTLFLYASHHNVVRHCVIGGNHQFDGISISGGTFNLVEHNLLYDNNRAGVFLVNTSQNTTIRFNLFVNNSEGIEMDTTYSSEPVLADWNDYFQNAKGAVIGTAAGAHDATSDPGFTEGADVVKTSNPGRWGPSGDATADSPSFNLDNASSGSQTKSP